MGKISTKAKVVASICVISLITGFFFTNCAKNTFEVAGDGGDPFLEYAWHIHNTGQKVFSKSGGLVNNDLNLLNTWSSGLSGKGITILVSDDGVEDTHEDLKDNYLYGNVSKNYTTPFPYLANSAPPIASDDDHGTSVAGLIAAVANNGVGTKGVAFGAKIATANYLSTAVTNLVGNGMLSYDAITVDQAGGTFDIHNMSWGADQNTLSGTSTNFIGQVKNQASVGRNGKGTIFVKAAGNNYFVKCHGSSSDYCVGNSNFDEDNSMPYLITAGALNADGVSSSYSSPGANIWVASFGGEFGDDSPAMVTTDRMGCSKGRSVTNISSTIAFEKGGDGNSSCNYTVAFNGTSSAAPVLSGSIALILEANPHLSWRDVKHILAKTATPVEYITDGSITPNAQLVGALPTNAVWEQVWKTNGAGRPFHNWYGFGRVNVDAAVAMAKSYTFPLGATFMETGWGANTRSGLSIGIPDFSATGASDTMTASVGGITKLEAVQLRVYITHPYISDLAIELTSPSGMKSIIVNMQNSLRGIQNYQGSTMLTNAFYQENPAGNWTIRVIDGKAGNTGTLTGWSLNFFGSN